MVVQTASKGGGKAVFAFESVEEVFNNTFLFRRTAAFCAFREIFDKFGL